MGVMLEAERLGLRFDISLQHTGCLSFDTVVPMASRYPSRCALFSSSSEDGFGRPVDSPAALPQRHPQSILSAI
jgi:hypothetical protein